MSAYFFYTLFYFLMSGCIVYPPTEFVSAGLTIRNIFANWLGSENEFFIQYHIKRSVITLFVHCMLPFGYILGLAVFGHIDLAQVLLGNVNLFWFTITTSATLVPLYVLFLIVSWALLGSNWSTHPIAKALSVYSNDNNTWITVASNINIEYRRIDKIVIDTNSVTQVVVTDNWIIKVTPYKLDVAHQSDTALVLNRSDTHVMSHTSRGEVQYVNIEVKPTRPRSRSFNIRLNALDFKDLQDKVSRPIVVLQNVTFHRTLLDRFIDTFKEQVAQNPHYETAQELEQCIGCMQVTSNVKLNKLCGDITEERGPDACVTCFCRPMWCIDCMAKWFASRQDENSPETWLSSKCTCPVCRARFCLLDVCLIPISNN
ncbi:E3 ubiquitin-protein ligase TM129 isoform X2 [Diprion similis]|uniref:E3 ubiquitin-protein ligase TM129 isoform X1 n=1 Tax=Diprion similis TaxID=362088 RepID=UPI001EF7F1B0|nr:E3 ubiquitin-protein ligase TM129 isoform X1 [Diprion similis]XP_046743392.1 E3 ubiquitin-protein ligase TM129 isoform X2 [Diprion similis]